MWYITFIACNPDPGASSKGDGPDVTPPPIVAGSRTLQRLNRSEFQRTLRDLTGIDRDFSSGLPEDDSSYGFDNQGAALNLTVGHLEAIEAVVDQIATDLLEDKNESDETIEIQGEGPGTSYAGTGALSSNGSVYVVYDGEVSTAVSLESDGQFELTVRAAGDFTGDASILAIEVDNELIASEPLLARTFTDTRRTVRLDEGLHTIRLSIANPSTSELDRRSIGIDSLTLDGPDAPEVGRTAAWRKIVPCAPEGNPNPGCRSQVFEDFGLLAWRRPLSEADLAWLDGLSDATIDAGGTADEGLVAGVRGLLLAPEFLFRIEADPEPGQAERDLDGYEVATRLAAFLWSSTPDLELLQAASDGSLLDEDSLDRQVERMIRDPRAESLVADLAGQWFDIRNLDVVVPDATLFPDFDDELRASMRTELSLLSEQWFLGNSDFRYLVENDETAIDARLARHYGVGFDGTGFRPTYSGRIGITGTGGFLTAHSRPASASAVSRGKWVLENLLCSEPPPPPAEANMNMAFEPIDGSVRAQEEAFRGADSCQACHATMDAVGFSLGGFDGVGAARTEDEFGYPVDTSVELFGTPLDGQAELAALVANDARLPRCAAKKTLTFALGRPIVDADDPVLDAITTEFIESGTTFEALAKGVVHSAPFRRRSAPAPVEETP